MADCDLMLNIYATEDDIHLGCAKRARFVPPDATAQSHKTERKAFKACNLGVVYGARVPRIAVTAALTIGQAQRFYDLHRAMFPQVHEFCEQVVSHTRETRLMVLQDGWRKRTVPPFKPTTASNFPVQGTAAGILRRAVLGCHDAGLPLIATVHDSLVFEVRVEDAAALILTATRIMGDASEWFHPRAAAEGGRGRLGATAIPGAPQYWPPRRPVHPCRLPTAPGTRGTLEGAAA